MAHIEYSTSFKCLDCAVIGDRSEACACCGSQSIFNLARVLERDAIAVRREVAAIMGVNCELMCSELHETFEVRA